MSPQQRESAVTRVEAEPVVATVSVLKNEAELALADLFSKKRGLFIGSSEIALRREAAFARFAKSGLPSKRVEAWHYTDLRAALRIPLPIAEFPDNAARALARPCIEALRAADPQPVTRFVILDGIFDAELSTSHMPAGVSVTPTCNSLIAGEQRAVLAFEAGGLGENDPALNLNEAFSVSGVLIDIADGAMIDQPIEIVFLSSGAHRHAIYSRSSVRIGEGAVARIVERRCSNSSVGIQRNEALYLNLGDRAIVRHVAIAEADRADCIDIASTLLDLKEGSELTSTSLVHGGGLRRRQIFGRFNGPHARCSLRGVVLLGGKEHADTTIVMEHVAPNCESRETFNHIIDDEATGVFQGKVSVAPEAQKTDGKMKSRAILLSETASMNNKPELEIFADDVTCGHGATCGSLDDDQLFYVQSRGLPKAEAEALLLEGFAGEIILEIANEQTREVLMDDVRAWLSHRALRGN